MGTVKKETAATDGTKEVVEVEEEGKNTAVSRVRFLRPIRNEDERRRDSILEIL